MKLLFGLISINSGSMHLSDANMALSAFLSFICKYSVLSHFMMVQIRFISNTVLGVYLNRGYKQQSKCKDLFPTWFL